MSYSLSYIVFDNFSDIKYQEHYGYTHIIAEISSDDFDEDIMINLTFPISNTNNTNNTNITIKINKYCSISNISTFIEKKFGFSNISMIYNDSVIKYGSFESNNIKNNSIIKIINKIQTGRTLIQHYSYIENLLPFTKNKSSNIQSKMSRENINDNIDKYGYWGAFTESTESIESSELTETPKTPKTQKKKVKNLYNFSPEYIYDRKRKTIDSSELENLGKKYHIAMKELFECEQKEKIEEDKMRSKIRLLKEKMKKSNVKNNKGVV
jgi:hypothetical protein